jgi:hypothetical protein
MSPGAVITELRSYNRSRAWSLTSSYGRPLILRSKAPLPLLTPNERQGAVITELRSYNRSRAWSLTSSYGRPLILRSKAPLPLLTPNERHHRVRSSPPVSFWGDARVGPHRRLVDSSPRKPLRDERLNRPYQLPSEKDDVLKHNLSFPTPDGLAVRVRGHPTARCWLRFLRC